MQNGVDGISRRRQTVSSIRIGRRVEFDGKNEQKHKKHKLLSHNESIEVGRQVQEIAVRHARVTHIFDSTNCVLRLPNQEYLKDRYDNVLLNFFYCLSS